MKIVKDPRFLHWFLQEEIYSIASKEEGEASEETPPKEYKLLLLTYQEGEENPFSKDEQAFLHKVLKAVSIDREEVLAYNLAYAPQIQSWKNRKHIPAPYVLALGNTRLSALPQEFYQLQAFENAQIVQAHSLAEIEADREKKKKLWTILQKMFIKN